METTVSLFIITMIRFLARSNLIDFKWNPKFINSLLKFEFWSIVDQIRNKSAWFILNFFLKHRKRKAQNIRIFLSVVSKILNNLNNRLKSVLTKNHWNSVGLLSFKIRKIKIYPFLTKIQIGPFLRLLKICRVFIKIETVFCSKSK